MYPKLKYFLTCASKWFTPERFRCPSCGSRDTATITRKYLVTCLKRCSQCELLFRAPTTTSAENEAFYQHDYQQGFTSYTPDDATLQALLKSRFVGNEKDYTHYLQIIAALGGKPGERVFDFGCSWGYGSWQIAQQGYNVTSFEISKPRCQFAREKLGVNAFDRLADVKEDGFDIFFSAHVLEHVPSVSEAIAFAKSKLRKGGLFVAFTPNGSQDFREAQYANWVRLWGMVHPNFLDDRFYRKQFANVILSSDPYDIDGIRRQCAEGNGATRPLAGSELMAAVRV